MYAAFKNFTPPRFLKKYNIYKLCFSFTIRLVKNKIWNIIMVKKILLALPILLLITGCTPQKDINQTTPKIFKTEKMYYEHIYARLAIDWNPNIDSLEKLTNVIEFNIDVNGQFKYSIMKNSNNLEFDQYVIDYLERQKKKKFLFFKRKVNHNIRLTLGQK